MNIATNTVMSTVMNAVVSTSTFATVINTVYVWEYEYANCYQTLVGILLNTHFRALLGSAKAFHVRHGASRKTKKYHLPDVS